MLIALGIGIPVVIGMANASKKRDQERNEVVGGTAINVTAQQLYADYETNEVSADTMYRDKVLRVTGKVDRIGKDFTDDAYVVLAVPNSIIGVRANFDGVGSTGSLKPGQEITVRCRGKAKVMGPSLDDCVLE